MPDRSAPAAPAVPPTPPVPLAALLAREDLALRQIAGPSGSGVAVHWAQTSEMSDPYPYLLGGELLLTAGVHIPGAAGSDGGAPGRAEPGLGEYFDDYVARIVAAGGAALGFGVAPVHDTVPRGLVAACEAYGLPLVEVPPQTTFSGVARAVWQLMAQARLAELRRVTEAQQSLASAASRPDPVPAVLRQLAQRLGGRACLYGPDGTEIASAGRPPEDDVRTALNHLTQVVRPLPTTPRPTPDTPSPTPEQTPGSPPPRFRTPAPAPRSRTPDPSGPTPRSHTPSSPPPTDRAPLSRPPDPTDPTDPTPRSRTPDPSHRPPDPTDPAPRPRPPDPTDPTPRPRPPDPSSPTPSHQTPDPTDPTPRPRTPELTGPASMSGTPEPNSAASLPTVPDAGRPAPTEEAAPSAAPAEATAPVHTCADDRTPPSRPASPAPGRTGPAARPAPAPGRTGPAARPAPGPATPAQAADPGRAYSAGHASAPTTACLPAAARPATTSGPAASRTATTSGPAAVDRAAPVVSAAGGAVGRGGPASATDAVGGTHLAAYSLGNGQGFVLGIVVPRREPGDHTIASVAAVLLSLLTGEHQSGAGAARSAALVRLLLGAAPEDVAPLLGDGRWHVVHARPQSRAADAVAGSALGAALGSALVDTGRDVVRVLVPADREPAPQPGWTLGVSAPVAPHEWPSADAQAARALTRARVTGTALVRHGGRAGLAGLVPADEAEGFARELLAPLAGRPALAETLRSWLSLHGSWDRTAVALAVHRNTVRQRIGRCAALLGADLDDPDVRMELWFALKHGE
ncbi:helix-turn-helix domain-containing protein [Streptomyces sp. NPDC001508]|uniref:helix-turn-helix domain-containing protein n=1 Tax=Streptomyces sp. NPDC001508 TaxID=3154656 RepID=UPI0033201AAC